MSPREVMWRARATLLKRRPPQTLALDGVCCWMPRAPWPNHLHSNAAALFPEAASEGAPLDSGTVEFWGHRADLDMSAPDWRLDVLRAERPSSQNWRDWDVDLKPAWELHRHQNLPPLAAAGYLGGDEDRLRRCRDFIMSWIEQNPFGSQPGWASGFETAHRLVAWAWTIPFLDGVLDGRARDEIWASYRLQAAFVAANPSRFSSANNHRLMELLGLQAAAISGVAVPLDEIWAEFEEHLNAQLYGDGGTKEQGSGYFFYVLELVWVACVMRAAAGASSGSAECRLLDMLRWLDVVVHQGEELPLFGDDSEDRVLRLTYFAPPRAHEIRKRVVSYLEERHIAAPAAADDLDQLTFEVLPESGFAVGRMRSDEGPLRIVMDIGELGFGSIAAHGHADALSLTMSRGRDALLRDSGTYTYASNAGRSFFLGTSAHNTVEIGEANQAELLGPHLWGRRFRVSLEGWGRAYESAWLRASHDGYEREFGASHTRTVLFIADLGLVVLDKVSAARPVPARLWWHPGPGLDDRTAQISVSASLACVREESVVPYSPRYASVEQVRSISWSATGAELVFCSVLGPSVDMELAHGPDGITRVVIERPEHPFSVRETWSGAPSLTAGVG